MASGQIRLTSGTTAWLGYINWSSSQNIADNTSTVTANLYAYKTDGYTTGANSPNFIGTLKIGSQSVNFSYTNEYNDSSGAGVRHASLSATIAHDSATGEGSVYIGGSISGAAGTSLSGKTLSGGETVGLGTIARASTISANKETVQMLTPLILSIDRKNANFTHNLYYYDFVQASWILFASNVANSYTWNVPDIVASMPDMLTENLYIMCATYSGGSCIGNHTIHLTITVPDATVPSLESNRATMGTAKTISCKRNSVSFRTVLKFEMGERSETIADGTIDSYSWSPSYEFAKQIPNLTYGTGTLVCETYNGSAFVGSKEIVVQLIVPENDTTKPAFTSDNIALSVLSDLTGDLSALYIRGRTGVKAEFSAQSEYSTINGYELMVGSVSATGNPAIIDSLVNDGTVSVTAKVTDARGFTRTATTYIDVLPYQKPKVIPYTGYSEVICERAKSTGELNSEGTYLAIRAGKSYSSFVIDGIERNSCVLQYRYKVSGAEIYGNWVQLLGSGDAENQISILISDVVSSTSTSYDVELEAADAIGGKHTLHFQIMTSQVSFVLYDGVDGAGFGKYPEAPHVVDIASHMTLLVRGKLVVLGSDWEPLTFASGVYESSYDFGRVVDCKYQVKEGNHVYVSFNCSFTHSGAAITINGSQIPEEYRPPRAVRSICPVNGNGTALVCVKPDGFIQVESVERAGETGEHPILWIDGYLDYWT